MRRTIATAVTTAFTTLSAGLLLALAGGAALAQDTPPGTPSTTPPRPPNLQPLAEPPPPPKGYELDGSTEPEVTTTQRNGNTVEEYRVGGKLYMMKVTPPGSAPYFMVDLHGNGEFARQSGWDTGLRPPMWVIHSF